MLLRLPQQKEHVRLQKLNAEIETIEESLQEERMERVKLEVEIGREKDCNRVRRTSGSPPLLTIIPSFIYTQGCPDYTPNSNFYSNSLISELFEGLSCRVRGRTDPATLSHLSICSLPQVQLCETRRELQELKTSLRVTQKEKEQLLAEKQVRQTGFFTA